MHINGYGLDPGYAADLVIVPGATVTDAVVSRPTDRVVVKRGALVARGRVHDGRAAIGVRAVV